MSEVAQNRVWLEGFGGFWCSQLTQDCPSCSERKRDMNSRNLFSESVQPSPQDHEFDPVLCTNFARSEMAMASLQRQRQVQSSYIVPDQMHDPEVMVGQILKIDSENSCLFCVLSNLGNLELAGNTKWTKSFEPDSILSNFGDPRVAPIEVFPREYSIMRNSRILCFADFPTCTKEFDISYHSGFPRWLGLKTCTKDSIDSCSILGFLTAQVVPMLYRKYMRLTRLMSLIYFLYSLGPPHAVKNPKITGLRI